MKKAKQTAQLSFGLIVTDPDAYRIEAKHKTRRCLSCSTMFASHGPGNRICGDCKETETWKVGASEFTTVSAAASSF